MPTPDISTSNEGRLLAFIGWPWYLDVVKNYQKGYSKHFLSKYYRFVCQVLYLN